MRRVFVLAPATETNREFLYCNIAHFRDLAARFFGALGRELRIEYTDMRKRFVININIVDLVSPGQLQLIERSWGKQLAEAGAALKFAPSEGSNIFARYGWEPKDVQD